MIQHTGELLLLASALNSKAKNLMKYLQGSHRLASETSLPEQELLSVFPAIPLQEESHRERTVFSVLFCF